MGMIIKTSLLTQEKCMFRGFCQFFLHDFAFKNLKKVIVLVKEKNVLTILTLTLHGLESIKGRCLTRAFTKQGSTLASALYLFP